VVLPQGLHLRVHGDGALDVLDDPRSPAEHFEPPQAAEWLAALDLPHLRPADFTGPGPRRGILISLLVEVGLMRAERTHLVPLEDRGRALRLAATLAAEAERTGRLPLNLECWSGTVGAGGGPSSRTAAGACVYVDFDDPGAEELLRAECFAGPLAADRPEDAARAMAERLGPPGVPPARDGSWWTDLDGSAVAAHLEQVERLARAARLPLEWRAVFLRRGRARVRTGFPAGPGMRGTLLPRVLRFLIRRRLLVRGR
jgi:hypothetical protein